MKLGLAAATAVIAAIISIAAVFDYYFRIYEDTAAAESVNLTLTAGSSLNQINAAMEEAEVLRHPLYWRLHLYLNGMSRKLKAGRYQITVEDTLYTIGEKLLNHQVLMDKFTIVEGWTLQQLLAAMRDHALIETENLDAAELKRRLKIEEPSAEGWIYPDTYLFSESINSFKLLAQAHEIMKEILLELWENRKPGLPLKTPYEALILASVVEKESGIHDAKARIAGVLILRLKQGMRLQSDPTVIYGLGEHFDGNLRKKDLAQDTPYNTYVNGNLPPTPIAIPSRSALEAVMHPNITGDLYFVSKGDGSHYFSKTYQEHQKAVVKYQLKHY